MKKLLKKIIPRKVLTAMWHLPKAVCAAFLFGFPARGMTVIAVAGTKGKTSTTYYLSHLLDTAGISNALFSTGGLKIAGEEAVNTLKLTTPTPFFLQSFLRRAKKAKCTHVILEVSSHAIDQHRLWGVSPSHLIITNLASDHLEYHASASEYRAVHSRLIGKDTRTVIVNADDEWSGDFMNTPHAHPYSHTHAEKKYGSISLPVIGTFNQDNAWMAAEMAEALEIDDTAIRLGLSTLPCPPGRMEMIHEGQPFDIIVDYAHSVESLEKFFAAVRQTVSGKIIAVFGACGDRDPRPRPAMGSVLDRYADMLILTTDDPYSERPEDIATQVMEGIKRTTNFSIILDRRAAIVEALSLAREGDCVCILGKGAEQWQVFSDKKIPWDDRHVVREELSRVRMKTQ